MTSSEEVPAEEQAVDLDVAGLCHLRVHGASDRALARIVRELGATRRDGPSWADTPDLTVRFGADLSEPLTLIGNGAGYGADGLVVLRGPRRSRVRVALPLDAAGPPREIRCQGHDGPVPHLVALVNLSMLDRGILPLHASAFVSNDRTVLIAGWSKGGKTEVLSAFVRRGASYVGDEWVYVTADGRVHGLPEPVRLWRWQLDQLPHVRRSMSTTTRLRLEAVAALAGVARIAEALPGGGSFRRRVAGLLSEQLWVRIPPEVAFGPRLAPAPPPSDLVLVTGVEGGYRVEPSSVGTLTERVILSTAFEFAPLVEHYHAYRFGAAGTGPTDPLLDDLERRLRTLARSHLPDDARATVITHPPPPFDLARLHARLAPRLADAPRSGRAGSRTGEATDAVMGRLSL